WQKRLRVIREKVAAGTAVGLAEVVRDSARREEIRTRGNGAKLSMAEQGLYHKARQLLADEIGCSLGIPTTAANDWIDEQLSAEQQDAYQAPSAWPPYGRDDAQQDAATAPGPSQS